MWPTRRLLPGPLNRISVLVNAAGVALGDAPAHLAEWPDWQMTINTNVTGFTAALLDK
jgi:NADP-dependent 3-hydroxy acid dehydrogenase YdfG